MTDQKPLGFQDIRDEVVNRIQTRVWPQGSLLPTEMELAAEFGVARATVNRALRELAEQGIVTRKRKGGTRVVTTPVKQAKLPITVVRQTIEEMNAEYRYALVSRTLIDCPAWLQAKLNIPEGAQVVHLQCMHHADNRPFQFEERWINVSTVPQVLDEDFLTTGPNEWLLSEVPFSNAEIAFCRPGNRAFAGVSGGTARHTVVSARTHDMVSQRSGYFRAHDFPSGIPDAHHVLRPEHRTGFDIGAKPYRFDPTFLTVVAVTFARSASEAAEIWFSLFSGRGRDNCTIVGTANMAADRLEPQRGQVETFADAA